MGRKRSSVNLNNLPAIDAYMLLHLFGFEKMPLASLYPDGGKRAASNLAGLGLINEAGITDKGEEVATGFPEDIADGQNLRRLQFISGCLWMIRETRNSGGDIRYLEAWLSDAFVATAGAVLKKNPEQQPLASVDAEPIFGSIHHEVFALDAVVERAKSEGLNVAATRSVIDVWILRLFQNFERFEQLRESVETATKEWESKHLQEAKSILSELSVKSLRDLHRAVIGSTLRGGSSNRPGAVRVSNARKHELQASIAGMVEDLPSLQIIVNGYTAGNVLQENSISFGKAFGSGA